VDDQWEEKDEEAKAICRKGSRKGRKTNQDAVQEHIEYKT
jgi:hypothetical protein